MLMKLTMIRSILFLCLKITSALDQDLNIEGDTVQIRGNEGLSVESKDTRIRGKNVVFNSVSI